MIVAPAAVPSVAVKAAMVGDSPRFNRYRVTGANVAARMAPSTAAPTSPGSWPMMRTRSSHQGQAHQGAPAPLRETVEPRRDERVGARIGLRIAAKRIDHGPGECGDKRRGRYGGKHPRQTADRGTDQEDDQDNRWMQSLRSSRNPQAEANEREVDRDDQHEERDGRAGAIGDQRDKHDRGCRDDASEIGHEATQEHQGGERSSRRHTQHEQRNEDDDASGSWR